MKKIIVFILPDSDSKKKKNTATFSFAKAEVNFFFFFSVSKFDTHVNLAKIKNNFCLDADQSLSYLSIDNFCEKLQDIPEI